MPQEHPGTARRFETGAFRRGFGDKFSKKKIKHAVMCCPKNLRKVQAAQVFYAFDSIRILFKYLPFYFFKSRIQVATALLKRNLQLEKFHVYQRKVREPFRILTPIRT